MKFALVKLLKKSNVRKEKFLPNVIGISSPLTRVPFPS